jgi:endonuclease III
MMPGCKAEVTRSDGHFFRMYRFYTGYPKPPSALPRDLLTWFFWHNDRVDMLKEQWINFGREHCRKTACNRYIQAGHEEGAFVDALTDSDPSSE